MKETFKRTKLKYNLHDKVVTEIFLDGFLYNSAKDIAKYKSLFYSVHTDSLKKRIHSLENLKISYSKDVDYVAVKDLESEE